MQGVLTYKWGMPLTGRMSEWGEVYLSCMNDIGRRLECVTEMHKFPHKASTTTH